MTIPADTSFRKRYLWMVTAIALWMVLHVVLRSVSPSFAEGPLGPARSRMSLLFRLEWIGHLVVLGIALKAIENRIPWLRKPTYGDEGLLSIGNAAKLKDSDYEVLPVRWNEIGWIVGGLLNYALTWTWILHH
jgi:hypothetical protein